jgi:uncharacterized protein YheU (UPF0270 family)
MKWLIMIIPYQQISPDALQGLIEEFITREGTDYGEEEISLAQKVGQVERQLTRGDVVIVFDAATESVSILTKYDAKLIIPNDY